MTTSPILFPHCPALRTKLFPPPRLGPLPGYSVVLVPPRKRRKTFFGTDVRHRCNVHDQRWLAMCSRYNRWLQITHRKLYSNFVNLECGARVFYFVRSVFIIIILQVYTKLTLLGQPVPKAACTCCRLLCSAPRRLGARPRWTGLPNALSRSAIAACPTRRYPGSRHP